jgi:hypothetical protein
MPSRIMLTVSGRGPVRGPVSVSDARVGSLAPAPRSETLIVATVIHLSRVFAWWTETANMRTIQAGRAAAISLGAGRTYARSTMASRRSPRCAWSCRPRSGTAHAPTLGGANGLPMRVPAAGGLNRRLGRLSGRAAHLARRPHSKHRALESRSPMAFGAWAAAVGRGGVTSAFSMCGVTLAVKSGSRKRRENSCIELTRRHAPYPRYLAEHSYQQPS